MAVWFGICDILCMKQLYIVYEVVIFSEMNDSEEIDEIIQKAIEVGVEQKNINTKMIKDSSNEHLNSSIFQKTNGYSRSIDQSLFMGFANDF